jgi:hypothetical protein
MKAYLSQGRSEQVWTGKAPHNLALRSGGDPGGERCCRCAVNDPASTTCKLMDCAIREAAARKSFIDLSDPKRQCNLMPRARPFEVRDPVAEVVDNTICGHSGMVSKLLIRD